MIAFAAVGAAILALMDVEARPEGPVLFSPRIWGKLTDAERADPRALEVRYVIDQHDLATLGLERRWQARAA